MSDHEERPRPKPRSALTIELIFNKAKDKNEDDYFIGQDIGIEFPVPMGDFIWMFFPGKDNLPPKLVGKPRRDIGREDL